MLLNLSTFDAPALRELFTHITPRNITFHDKGPGIIMRHDVDDNIERSVKIAELEKQHNIKATFFILNTAPYWSRPCWDQYRYIQSLGHEIAWHNNIITQWIQAGQRNNLNELIANVLKQFTDQGFTIRGMASHGDSLCYQYKFVNYEAFTVAPKVNTLNYKQIDMSTHGLQYEAYFTGHNHYLSESGGKWRTEVKTEDLENKELRTQILIHPQWWKL